MNDDIVQQVKLNLENLDLDSRHQFYDAVKHLNLLDLNVLLTVVFVNDMSSRFEISSLGDNQFLDFILDHKLQVKIMEFSLPEILSLNSVFPGFVRATKLLDGLSRPN